MTLDQKTSGSTPDGAARKSSNTNHIRAFFVFGSEKIVVILPKTGRYWVGTPVGTLHNLILYSEQGEIICSL